MCVIKMRRNITQQTKVSTSAACKICHDDFPLFPHEMQFIQPLSEYGTARHHFFVEYGVLNEDNPEVLNVT